MKIAYADPPYPGQAEKHYSHDPRCAEVDHAKLIGRLDRDHDGWALSSGADDFASGGGAACLGASFFLGA